LKSSEEILDMMESDKPSPFSVIARKELIEKMSKPAKDIFDLICLDFKNGEQGTKISHNRKLWYKRIRRDLGFKRKQILNAMNELNSVSMDICEIEFC